jgi:hypothetical protein
VERSSNRTPSWLSSSVIRRLTVEMGIFRRRAAAEKLLDSTTFANTPREFRSFIVSKRRKKNHRRGHTPHITRSPGAPVSVICRVGARGQAGWSLAATRCKDRGFAIRSRRIRLGIEDRNHSKFGKLISVFAG